MDRMKAIGASLKLDEPSATFTLNGEVKTVTHLPLNTSLNTYIRDVAGLKGTKFMCREAGCGACVVSLTVNNPATGQENTVSVNSCLFPVYACHGAKVTTVEGIGGRKKGYHKVQSRLAQFYGTQCGYCSPGWVMSMYSLLESNPKVTMEEIEEAFSGNLCRCTGYRPILDAFKSFASNSSSELKKKVADVEEVLKVCPKSGTCCEGSCQQPQKKRPPYDCVELIKEDDFEMEFLEMAMAPRSLKLELSNGTAWYKVVSVDEIFEIFGMINGTYQLVAGNTASGVWKDGRTYETYIDINGVASLKSHVFRDNYLHLGANMTLTETTSLFNAVADENPSDFSYLKGLAKHIGKVANPPVRNVGTLAGNLMLKHTTPHFPSDIFLMMETVGALLKIRNITGIEPLISVEQFKDKDMTKGVITELILPPLNVKSYVVRTFKIASRAQASEPHVNAGFRFKVDKNNGFKVLEQPRIVIGGITHSFVHASKTESYLKGRKLFDNESLQGALKVLGEELVPDYILPDGKPEFRKGLAQALLYRVVLGLSPKEVSTRLQSGAEDITRPLSSGKQEFENDSTTRPPLYQPFPKLDALIQCSGEAEYTYDIPKVGGDLFAALVVTKKGPATLESLDATKALKIPGVVAFFSAKDIPGTNTFTPTHGLFAENEKLFADTEVLYAGHQVGVIVAETQELADKAADLVVINLKDTRTPVLDVRVVVKNNDTTRLTLEQEKAGVSTKPAVYKVVKGQFLADTQAHFTMETLTCVSVPTDDGGLEVSCTTQWLQMVQETIAVVLNIPASKVYVSLRRVGGSFGQKISRGSMVGGACGLAAYLLQRPVRMMVKLETMLETIGKRWSCYFNYEAGVTKEGEIKYMDLTTYSDAGIALNDGVITLFLMKHYMNVYNSENWGYKMYDVKTDKACTLWTRSPGTLEGITIPEVVMEHIAHEVGKDSLEVRLKNAVAEERTTNVINQIKEKSDYEARKQAVEEFNSNNVWKKRGISLVPMKFLVETICAYHAMVSVYRIDGSVVITHGGTEIGQGINVKAAQVAASALGAPLEKVTVRATNTVTAPNDYPTGGSFTSESVAYAIDKCCAELHSRMSSVVKEGMTWQEKVTAAFAAAVDLNASYMFTPTAKKDYKEYNVYGATVLEVEVDILTGEHRVVRVDLLEELGKSMNPYVDIGQIEGAFVMGLGYWTLEKIVHDPDTGKVLTNTALKYRVPGAKDIPNDFRVYLMKNDDNPTGILRSKAVGEPPLCMSGAVMFAIRQALRSARKDMGLEDEWFEMDAPFTIENIFLHTGVDVKQFKI